MPWWNAKRKVARVNPCGMLGKKHSVDTKIKISKTASEGYELYPERLSKVGKPGRVPWNKGLTKISDIRVAKNAESTRVAVIEEGSGFGSGSRNVRWSGGKRKKKCIVCGKSFYTIASTLLARACSRECSGKDVIRRRKASITRKRLFAEGKLRPTKARRIRYGSTILRSVVEAKVAAWLRRCRIRFRYEPVCFALKGRSYVPDFYLYKHGLWLEVKGRFYEDQDILGKIDELYELYLKKKNEEVCILTMSNLRKMGVI